MSLTGPKLFLKTHPHGQKFKPSFCKRSGERMSLEGFPDRPPVWCVSGNQHVCRGKTTWDPGRPYSYIATTTPLAWLTPLVNMGAHCSSSLAGRVAKQLGMRQKQDPGQFCCISKYTLKRKHTFEQVQLEQSKRHESPGENWPGKAQLVNPGGPARLDTVEFTSCTPLSLQWTGKNPTEAKEPIRITQRVIAQSAHQLPGALASAGRMPSRSPKYLGAGVST